LNVYPVTIHCWPNTAISKDGKNIEYLLKDFLDISLLENTDHEQHMAGLITHIQFDGELQPLTFALHGIMLVKSELLKVIGVCVFSYQLRFQVQMIVEKFQVGLIEKFYSLKSTNGR
jgi:hypothetical protein